MFATLLICTTQNVEIDTCFTDSAMSSMQRLSVQCVHLPTYSFQSYRIE